MTTKVRGAFPALALRPAVSEIDGMFDPIEAVKEFVRHPSVSTDAAFAEGMVGAREHVAGLLREMGLAVEIVDTPLHPVVLAKRRGDPSWPHVVIYGHYDVQPPDPLDLWETPPFEPTVRGDRLYGRGAADNKGPMMVHLAAAARLLEKHPNLPLNLTFLIEGEEEIGSPSFAGVLERHAEELKGDFVLLSDTQSPSTEQIGITTALRGIVSFEFELIGPKGDLHSGLHGGAVYNPIQALTEICASLHAADGSVAIEGFNDAVVGVEQWERDEIAKLGNDEAAYAASVGVKGFMPGRGLSPFEVTRMAPTLEFNGIGGGYQGRGEKTIIPSRAFAKVSCRLVANQTPEEIEKLVHAAVAERCPPQVQLKIIRGHSGPPYRVVPPDRPNTPADQNPHLANAFRAMDTAVNEVFGRPPLYLPEGGSVPIIGDIKSVLGMDSVMLGMFVPGDNLHAPNEGFDLVMFRKGIDVSERVLAAVAGVEA